MMYHNPPLKNLNHLQKKINPPPPEKSRTPRQLTGNNFNPLRKS